MCAQKGQMYLTMALDHKVKLVIIKDNETHEIIFNKKFLGEEILNELLDNLIITENQFYQFNKGLFKFKSYLKEDKEPEITYIINGKVQSFNTIFE